MDREAIRNKTWVSSSCRCLQFRLQHISCELKRVHLPTVSQWFLSGPSDPTLARTVEQTRTASDTRLLTIVCSRSY
jgi:hypothetical protein